MPVVAAARRLRARLLPPFIAALLAATLPCVAASAPAAMRAVGFTAFGGWYTDPRDRLLGAGVRAGIGPLAVVPNAEYVFTGDGRRYTLNLDATWTLMPLGVASAWVGAGLARHVADPDGGPAVRRSGVNLLAGIGLGAVPLKPYAQLKVVVMSGDHPAALVAGVRF